VSERRLWWRTQTQVRREVEEELAYHFAARVAELERGGLTPAEARREAARRFGDVGVVLRDCVASDLRRDRRVRRREFLADVVQDARIGMRQLLRRPLLSAIAVLILGVAIGTAAAIYAFADHVLLRPLPYDEPERVVTLWEAERKRSRELEGVSPANYLDWEGMRSFSAIGLAEPYGFDLTGDGPPVSLDAWLVTERFFPALGVRPLLGRLFTAEDYRDDANVVLLSHGAWQRRFGGDPRVVGRTLQLDGTATQVIGVLPPSLEYPEVSEVYAPKRFREEERTDRRSAYMAAVARLAPGAEVQHAQAELNALTRELAAVHGVYRERDIRVVPLAEQVLGRARRPVAALLAGVLLLVLIACANLANVLVARGMERSNELAVRAALGAGRARIARQLMTESSLVAVLGGATGIVLAWLGIRTLLTVAPPDLPRLSAVALDARVMLFLCATTAVTGVLFGVAPSLRLARQDLMSTVRAGVLRTREHGRLRGALLSGQVALCLVLLIGAGLLARSMTKLIDNDLGFEHEGRATVQLFLWDNVSTAPQRIARTAELIERFEALPGVRRAAAVTSLPFHPHAITARSAVVIEGAPVTPGEEPNVLATVATTRYLDVMGIPLLDGRFFNDTDRAGTTPVVVINEVFARLHFGGTNPIGRRVTLGVMAAPVERQIIGVIGSVRPTAFDSEPQAEFFIPHAQSGNGSLTFVVQTAGDPNDLIRELRDVVWSIDPNQTIYHSATLSELVGGTLGQRRFHLLLAALFAVVALALVVLGMYGVISLWARQRNHEFGVRMALGARARDITRLVVRQGLRFALPGVAAGVVAALLLTRGIEHMLYGVQPTDAITLVQVVLLLLVVVAAAAYVPARAAAARDPLRSIRE
jgi:putative ABC transport system permease protein